MLISTTDDNTMQQSVIKNSRHTTHNSVCTSRVIHSWREEADDNTRKASDQHGRVMVNDVHNDLCNNEGKRTQIKVNNRHKTLTLDERKTYKSFNRRKSKQDGTISSRCYQKKSRINTGYWSGRILRNLIQSMHMKRNPVVTLMLVLQLWAIICEGHECGDNPMKQVLQVAKRTGRTLSHVLTLLKEIDNPAYDNLSHQFRTYAACIGLVDTGYFRKRSGNVPGPHYTSILPRVDTYKWKPIGTQNSHKKLLSSHLFGGNSNFAKQHLRSLVEEPESYYIQPLKDQNPKKNIYKRNFEHEARSLIFRAPADNIDHRDNDENGEVNDANESMVNDAVIVDSDDMPNDNSEFNKKDSSDYSVDRLKKWLYGPYRNYLNSYYLRWNLLWPIGEEQK